VDIHSEHGAGAYNGGLGRSDVQGQTPPIKKLAGFASISGTISEKSWVDPIATLLAFWNITNKATIPENSRESRCVQIPAGILGNF